MSVKDDEGVYDAKFAVENIFTRNLAEPAEQGKGYWLGGDGTNAYFIIDLGCRISFSGIQLVNTHNGGHKDRSTKKFK